jgi:hypothetical protein
MVTTAHRDSVPRIFVRLANRDEILREQLEYLIDHAGDTVVHSCPECRRYLEVRSLLLQIFGQPKNHPV